MAESVKSVTPEPVDVETRRVVNMMCNVKPKDESCELLVRCQISAMPFFTQM
jgi:nuclear receptor-binding protein